MDERHDDGKKPVRFPDLPPPIEVPEAPRLETKLPAAELTRAPKIANQLPPRPSATRPGGVEPGGYSKLAIASTAATSFIMPIVILSVGGWWLDNRLHHKTGWLAFIGVLLGLVVGISSLMKVMARLQD
jgi:hypothetical protein